MREKTLGVNSGLLQIKLKPRAYCWYTAGCSSTPSICPWDQIKYWLQKNRFIQFCIHKSCCIIDYPCQFTSYRHWRVHKENEACTRCLYPWPNRLSLSNSVFALNYCMHGYIIIYNRFLLCPSMTIFHIKLNLTKWGTNSTYFPQMLWCPLILYPLHGLLLLALRMLNFKCTRRH